MDPGSASSAGVITTMDAYVLDDAKMKHQEVLDPEVRFKEGSIVCQYHPYAWTVSPKFVDQYCYRCGLDPRPAKVKRCSGCRHAHYCSTECQTLDWKDRHKVECKVMSHPVIVSTWEGREAFTMILAVLARVAKEIEGGNSDGGILRTPITAKMLKRMAATGELAPEMFAAYGDLFELCDPKHLYLQKDSTKLQAFTRLSEAIAARKRPMYGRVYDVNNQKHCTTRIIGTETHAFPMPIVEGCFPNALLSCCFSEGSPQFGLVTALRDIKKDDEIVIGEMSCFATSESRTKRFAMERRDDFTCSCTACSCKDPALRAEQYALKCGNTECSQPIPFDNRATQPCPSCGRNNSKQLHKAKPVITNMSQWLDEREPVVPRLDVVRAQITAASAILHPTNLLLGVARWETCQYLKQQKRDDNEEYISWLKQIVPSIELHLNKCDRTTQEVYMDIVSAHIKRKEYKDASSYLDVLMSRIKLISPEDRQDLNGALESGRLLLVDLGKPKPNGAKVNGFLRNLADYFLEDEIETYF